MFNTEWRFMLCFARAGAWKKTLLGVFLLFAGGMALGNVPQLPDWTKEKVPARVENVLGGSFMSVDPVLTDANTGASFNRYVYANNSPYNYIDPDGRAALAGVVVAPIVLVVGYKVATDPQARAFATRVFNAVVGALTPSATTSAPLLNNGNNEGSNGGNSSASAPPVPTDLVGDQSSSQAGPTKNGKRHTSGPLTPANGGTGDAKEDFDKLTGGTGQPIPEGDSRSKIPGAQIGANGIWIRPGTGDGARIEIPANGSKLPETLHY